MAAFELAVDRLTRPDDKPPFPELPDSRRREIADAVADLSPSRINAWGRRNRPMTWDEFRAFLIGLRELEL